MIKGKRILITGGNGFLGSHVVSLLNNGNDIIVPRSSEFDLTKEECVKKMFEVYSNIDIVIHIAADVGGIGYSSKHPAQQYYRNILMNTYILHYSYLNNVKKFVGIGSVCEYPAETPVPFKEENLWNGYPVITNDSYGLTKRMLLTQGIAYNREYGLNCIHLLPVNLYGPKDDFDLNNSHVIPALIRKILTAKQEGLDFVEVWGTGEESREFLFVEDAAEAIVKATELYDDVEPVNLGSGKEIKIFEIANIIKELVGYNGEFKYLNNGLGGQNRRMLDVSLAKEKFGFTANTSFIDGLKKTIEYYKSIK